LANYIQQRPSGYYLRYPIPKRFQSIVVARELKYSLQTRSLSIAKRKARTIVVGLEQLLQRHLMNHTELTSDTISELVQQYVNETREAIEESHLANPAYLDKNSLAYAEAQDLLNRYDADIKHSDFEFAGERAQELLAKAGIAVPAESLGFKMLCRQIIRAYKELHRYALDLAEGCDMVGEQSYLTPPQTITVAHQASAQTVSAGPIDNYIEKFLTNHKASKEISEATEVAYRTAFRDFTDVMGKLAVTKVNYDKACEFRDTLTKIPPNRNKAVAYRDKTTAELIALDLPRDKCLSSNTISGHLIYLGKLFSWLRAKEVVARNPFDEVTIQTEEEERPPYSDEDLKTIFNSALYVNSTYSRRATTTASYWWLPLMALYSGARISELLQMRLEDVTTSEGILAATVKEDKDKKQKTKTEAGKRTFPIHPKLLELGFQEYLEELRANSQDRVFAAIPLGKRTAGKNASTWWNERYSKHLPSEFKAEGKVFHSFRHSYVTHARNMDMKERHLKQMVGHIRGDKDDSSATEIYDHGDTIQALFESIKKVNFNGLDLSHLKDGWKKLKLYK